MVVLDLSKTLWLFVKWYFHFLFYEKKSLDEVILVYMEVLGFVATVLKLVDIMNVSVFLLG